MGDPVGSFIFIYPQSSPKKINLRPPDFTMQRVSYSTILRKCPPNGDAQALLWSRKSPGTWFLFCHDCSAKISSAKTYSVYSMAEYRERTQFIFKPGGYKRDKYTKRRAERETCSNNEIQYKSSTQCAFTEQWRKSLTTMQPCVRIPWRHIL